MPEVSIFSSSSSSPSPEFLSSPLDRLLRGSALSALLLLIVALLALGFSSDQDRESKVLSTPSSDAETIAAEHTAPFMEVP